EHSWNVNIHEGLQPERGRRMLPTVKSENIRKTERRNLHGKMVGRESRSGNRCELGNRESICIGRRWLHSTVKSLKEFLMRVGFDIGGTFNYGLLLRGRGRVKDSEGLASVG